MTIGADHRPEAPQAAGWLGELTNPRLLFLILALPLLCQWLVWFYWPASHGLDVTKEFVYLLLATDRLVHKYTIEGAKLVEVIQIPKTDPDPHGLALHDGYLYYCDSGLTDPGPGSAPGQVCRFKVS